MNNLRFIHTADWHADNDPKKQQKLESSLEQIVEYCRNEDVTGIIHAGDIWEKKQTYEKNSGVPIVLNYLKQLSSLVDFIFITKGNNSHDEPGSVALLHKLEPNIYAYEYPVVLKVNNERDVTDILREPIEDDEILRNFELEEANFIVSLVPYPTKASFLIEDSIDNNNVEFIRNFEQIFELIGDVIKPYSCPKLLAFHGNVVGSRLTSGQTLVSQDIMVAPSTLEKAEQDYYALGHIHLRQFFKPNLGYSGSIYNKNWGETEQKSFEVIEFVNGNMITITVPLTSAKPMIKLQCTFHNGEIENQSDDLLIQQALKDSEVRLRITVRENERKLITDDEVLKIKSLYGPNTKIEFNIIPDERESRSEKIMDCKSLIDEVREYAQVIDEKLNDTIEKKVSDLQEVL